MSRKIYFSLIELLVVIAIFMTLMSLLQPSFSKIQKQAQTKVCQSKLKTISNAAALQLEDYNGFLNPAGYVYDTSRPEINYSYMKIDRAILNPIGAMSKYLNENIRYDTVNNHYNDVRKAEFFEDFVCPSNDFEEGKDFVVTLTGRRAQDGTNIFRTPRNHSSYGFNDGFLGIPSNSNQTRAAGSINKVTQPSKMMHIGELVSNNYQWAVLAAWLSHMTLEDSYNAHTGNRLDWDRHQNAMNILFVDGHIEFIEFLDMQNVYTAKSIEM